MKQDLNKQKTIIQYIEDELDNFFEMHKGELPESGLYHRVINEVERILIQKTILHCDNVHSKAAKILGINRNTLRNKMQHLKIK